MTRQQCGRLLVVASFVRTLTAVFRNNEVTQDADLLAAVEAEDCFSEDLVLLNYEAAILQAICGFYVRSA